MKRISFTFYGVRGSHPVAGLEYRKYGGNTASLLCALPESIVILDAGTGIINLGAEIEAARIPLKPIHLFISHFHLDHIQGLPFFSPLYRPETRMVIHLPPVEGKSGEELLMSLFQPPFSPIGRKSIKAELEFRTLDPITPVELGQDTVMETRKSDTHPLDGINLFRLKSGTCSLVYATDVEFPNGTGDGLFSFCKGADVLVHDAQYLDEEYFDESRPRRKFGHSTVSMAARNASGLQVDRLFLFHYDPRHTDIVLESSLARAREIFPRSYLARENRSFEIN